MFRNTALQSFFALCFLVVAFPALAQDPASSARARHTFAVSGSQFLYDDRPYQILSGDLQYPRIPRAYWRDRLHKAHLMGLNTITTYAFWNVHEPQPGVYDFSGEKDLAEYLSEAQAEGLHVILRPGPYVCAEWDLGGYPAWLLKPQGEPGQQRSLVLRSTDPKYTAAVDRWLLRLGQEVKPFLIQNGGPILAIQLENEYGAFGDDKAYLEQLKASYKAAGLADGVLFTSNQADDLSKGSLPELPSVVNFGSGGARNAVAKLEAFRPDGPRMVGEYWAGWFDKWGEAHHETDGAKEAEELDFLLKQGFSVSLYLVHGGTNFGWMNGADSHTGTDYHPDTTSYDYDAPLDESGNPRYKFALFQKVIAANTHRPAAPVPAPAPHVAFPVSPVERTASLWRNLPMPVNSKAAPLTFEELGQNYGFVLYRTGLDEGDGGTLKLAGMHSYAQVYIDQQLVGTLDRRLGQDSLALPRQTRASTLDILVENTGRVNYSQAIRTEQAGLTGAVTLADKPLRNWENFPLPLNDLAKLHLLAEPCAGPCFYQSTLTSQHPADTFLDTHLLHHGQLWLGEHNLGRFDEAGPEFTLYTPAPWLEQGPNQVVFFDLRGDRTASVTSRKDPVTGPVTHSRENQ